MPGPEPYRERPSVVPGAVVWTRTADGSSQPVLPDGCMDIIWSDGDLIVAGPDTRPHPAGAAAGTQFVAVRFAPGTGPGVVGVPASELRDLRVPLDQLWPDAEVRRLADQVYDGLAAAASTRPRPANRPGADTSGAAASWANRLGADASWADASGADGSRADGSGADASWSAGRLELPARPLERLAIQRLNGLSFAGGPTGTGPAGAGDLVGVAGLAGVIVAEVRRGTAVPAIARSVGLSERQLRRRCLDLFGYGPKLLARVLRMNAALEKAYAGDPLAQIAATTGYADQAHLTRDIKDLTGASPSALIRRVA